MMLGPPPSALRDAGLGLWVNQPISRGSLRLASLDPAVDPAIELNLAGDDRDRERLRGCVERASAVQFPRRAGLRWRLIEGDVSGLDGTPLADLGNGRAVDEWINRTVDVSASTSAPVRSATPTSGEWSTTGGNVQTWFRLRVVDLSDPAEMCRGPTPI